MALFTDAPDRERNPLGGREAEGFALWLVTSAQKAREAWDLLREQLPLSNPMRYVAREAASHYAGVLAEWENVKRGRSQYVRDDLARDYFEVTLISKVMSAYGAAEYVRECGYGSNSITADGRPIADVSAEYLRTCIILAKYIGVSELDVYACRDDQAALMALRSDRG
ncbi:hypothetical protein ACFW2V_13420 [Streptomyces sp. NPDC058947]|uniref:hypothetical protein n=1 Tax=Streptomyces sp. NPDC058947 TaxID=3346675 RepID=UPI0036AA4F4B